MSLNKKKLKSKKYNILCTQQIRVFLELKTNLVFIFFKKTLNYVGTT